MPQDTTGKQSATKTNTIIYEEPVGLSSHSSNKTDVELQPNPVYGTRCDVPMNTNPAYESYKWLV